MAIILLSKMVEFFNPSTLVCHFRKPLLPVEGRFLVILIMQRVVRSVAGTALRARQLSSVAAENPRFTIAKNILVYNNIKSATNEAELDAAIKSSPTLDTEALPESIANMKEYLTAAPEAGGEGFKADPTAWQNMSFGSYIGVEASRDMTWPFLMGGM